MAGTERASTSLFVVSIDFGTTFSGYCYCVNMKNAESENIRNPSWGIEHSHASPKTPTCILFNENRKFSHFGYDAVMKYKNMSSSEAKHWYYFEHFKMKLYNQKIDEKLVLYAKNSEAFPAIKVFSESLRFLKNHVIMTINATTHQSVIGASDVTWVLTVPAIWDPGAKQFMRKAALESGIIKEMNSDQLLLALEPEAASMWCKQLPMEGFINEHSKHLKFRERVGAQYIVVDCGGGTIDITVHEILEGGFLKELHCASGGDWGGTKVDLNFNKMMGEMFGDIWYQYQQEHLAEYQRMMFDFTCKKCTPSEDGIFVTCYYNLSKLCLHQVENYIQMESVEWSEGNIFIRNSKLKDFFGDSIAHITQMLEDILDQPSVKGIEYILLVGGFALSKILQEAIRTQFKRRCTVLVPFDAQLAVAKGAVLFGHNPAGIKERISRLTYGISVVVAFNPKIHPKSKKLVLKSGEIKCKNVFSTFVKKGETVRYNEDRKHIYYPLEPDNTCVCFQFYSTPKQFCDKTQFIDDKGMNKITEVSVPLPGDYNTCNRDLALRVKFGFTEISATITDEMTGTTKSVTFDFLTQWA